MGLRGTAFRLLVAGGVGVSLLLATALPTAADDVSDAQARLQTINKLKGVLKDNLQKAEAQEIALQQQLQETRDTISQTIDKIAATERRIAELERQIAALDAQIAEEQLELRKTKDEYARFVRSAYKSDGDPLAMLLAAPDFQGFLNRAVAIEHLTYLANRLIDHIHQVDRLLHNQQEGVKGKKQEADKNRADLVDQKAALLTQQAHQQDLENRMRQSIAQDQLIAEAEQAAWQQAQFWMQHNLFTLPNAGANHSTKYPLIWPLQQGSITLVFGPCTQSFEPPGFGYAHFHTGVDVAYNQGSPILAADDGVVVAAGSSLLNGQLVGYGNYIIVAHRNNFFSLYGHLLGFQVKAGDSVRQGQLIGYEGSTGNSTGPHVHFEYRYGGQPTNPLPYLPPNGPNTFSQ
jgi:murein DD-endopeptidase MepM/ murein hydrolase activator NlpD